MAVRKQNLILELPPQTQSVYCHKPLALCYIHTDTICHSRSENGKVYEQKFWTSVTLYKYILRYVYAKAHEHVKKHCNLSFPLRSIVA